MINNNVEGKHLGGGVVLFENAFDTDFDFIYDFAKPTDFMNEENFHLDLQNLSQSLYSELRDFFRQSARCGSALSICSDGRVAPASQDLQRPRQRHARLRVRPGGPRPRVGHSCSTLRHGRCIRCRCRRLVCKHHHPVRKCRELGRLQRRTPSRPGVRPRALAAR